MQLSKRFQTLVSVRSTHRKPMSPCATTNIVAVCRLYFCGRISYTSVLTARSTSLAANIFQVVLNIV